MPSRQCRSNPGQVDKGQETISLKSLPARSMGTLHAVILYGHPDSDFSRRATHTLHLVIVKTGREQQTAGHYLDI